MEAQHMGRKLAVIILMSTLTTFSPATSHAQNFTCAAADPAGDPNLSPGLGFDGAPYQDILETGIQRSGGATVFSMEVAAPIPASPGLKTPNGRLLWMWGMSTAPGAPQGFPLSPGVAGALEFWIDVTWDGVSFTAEVIDRRPALEGGEPIITSVPFTIDGANVTVTANSALFGDLHDFHWGSSTWFWPGHLGSTAPHVVDRAPDGLAPGCP